ncbi:MAG TPA: S1 RNA-binding domain-containing protein [Caldilineaceae bacterium]|nr:S1 RNA-binding domain-containing protein [Caldilineaceae bacterium]
MSDRVEMVAEQEQAGKVGGEDNTPAEESTPEAAPAVSAEATSAQQDAPAAAVDAQVEAMPVAEAKPAPVEAPKAQVEQQPAAQDRPKQAEPEVAVPAAAESKAGTETKPAGEPKPESEIKPQGEPSRPARRRAERSESGENRRVVRMLSVGQQVTGTVKRVADFGAFVDIGVGRDGLIHISELSVRRVGKVTDVLTEGQEVTAWIKKLDRERNRISLTLIDPNTKTIRDLEKGQVVQGTVTRILPYGAFVDIGIGRDALLHVREMGEGYVAKPEDVVKVGDAIEARIIELSRRRGRVDLSLKGLRPEPEPVQQAPAPARPEPEPEPEPEEEPEEDFADEEMLSPMQLAFKRAMEAEGIQLKLNKKSGRRKGRDRTRSIQDEIIARTLSSGKK